MLLVGIVLGFAGFTGLFWHFSTGLGVVFLISTYIAVTLSGYVTGTFAEVQAWLRASRR
jgi:hypothetical protein